MTHTIAAAALLVMALGPVRAAAWSDHASLLWPLVQAMPALNQASVAVEPLDAFLADEATGLEELLRDQEARARTRFEPYAPRPAPLAFDSTAPDLRRAFLEAIRVNPTLAYAPYRQVLPGEALPGVQAPLDARVTPGATALPGETAATAATAPRLLHWADLSFLGVGTSHETVAYLALAPGETVSAAQVLAAANDEPDMGIDIGLFEDNGTEFGARYGFGTQPFGNPNLEYGSQAPFHMGFYHLDWLTRTVQPDLLRTYPAWRVDLFGSLAQFAFATGHDYWGWRFAGWALHYIGDLTQPYHAQPLPGVGTAEALWLVIRGRTAQAVQLVSNRHGVIESYQYQRLQAALQTADGGSALLAAIRGAPSVAWQDSTLVSALARESVEAGASLDAALVAAVPPRFVADPGFEWTGSGEEARIVETVRAAGGEDAIATLDGALELQLERFGRYARAWIEFVSARAAP